MNHEHKTLVATQEQLRELHALFTETLVNYFATTPAHKRRASMLEVCRKFLADNGVEHSDRIQALEALGQHQPAHDEAMDGLDVPF